MKDRHPLIDDYLAHVCSRVKARELHKEIKQEMESHLDELLDMKREEGWDEDAAARWAVEQMGDADAVGSGLNRVHKPRIPWGLVAWVAVLLVISLVAMYAVELSYAAMPQHRLAQNDWLLHKAVFTAASLMVMGALIIFDYRKLLHSSWLLYWGTVAVSAGVLLFGRQVNGMKSYLSFGAVTIDWMNVSPFLFIISAAGILHGMDSSRRSGLVQTGFFVVVPVLLYGMAPSISAMLLYMAAYLLLLYSARKSWKAVLLQPLVLLLPAALMMFSSRYGQMRLAAFFQRYEDPLGAGYMYVQIDQAVRSAGWWGHGWASVNARLPEIHTDTIFTYLIYSLGWIAGAVIATCFVLFVVQLIQMGLEVRDRYGKMLISGLAGMFAFQFIWSLGMSVGILPILGGITTPFVSYGGSHLLAELAAVGIMFSIYRRKDMIRVRL
ncbi:FtsW/RodA/SpoVE family cell cycle protein [Paenibacillus sp. NPDC056579]|uniref:FtsW/RodA/SpoVE family cell cycle protein n=1 Tax=Paenibacillus sp. NPDC056579 TaxID=3345871 RepID=UPI003687A75D